MPLPNTATIQDVIGKLEELQGFNQKTELASVIGLPAEPDDNIAEQILKLQGVKDDLAGKVGLSNTDAIQAMVDAISSGRNVSIGNATRASSTSLNITGIPFRPKIVFGFNTETAGVSSAFHFLASDGVFVDRVANGNTSNSTANGALTVTFSSNGVSLSATTSNIFPNINYTYIAIGE